MMSFIFRTLLSMAAVALPCSCCRLSRPQVRAPLAYGFESNLTDKSLMPHSSFVRWAYPGEDVHIPSSRGSGILSCQARALRFEPSVGPLSAPVHLCPCARQWHVAIPRRYIGAPELRLVVGELTSSCSHPFRDSCCVTYGNLQRSFCALCL